LSTVIAVVKLKDVIFNDIKGSRREGPTYPRRQLLDEVAEQARLLNIGCHMPEASIGRGGLMAELRKASVNCYMSSVTGIIIIRVAS
jgi:hypothetical protein